MRKKADKSEKLLYMMTGNMDQGKEKNGPHKAGTD